MSVGAGLLVSLVVTWLAALALYVYALRLEYRGGRVQQRSYEPAVNSVIWDGLVKLYQATKAAKIPSMSHRWVQSQKRVVSR